MTKILFSTKAQTLVALQAVIKTAMIKPLMIVTNKEWLNNSQSILNLIQAKFNNTKIVVRSSCKNEDQVVESKAGAYKSFLNLNSADLKAISRSIEAVFESYQACAEDLVHQEVLIQEQVCHVKYSGVVFTCDQATQAPYYIVNYDQDSGTTDSVTSGKSNQLKTYIRFKKSPFKCSSIALGQIVAMAEELEQLFDLNNLDIEFALDENQHLFLLQVRPLIVKQMTCSDIAKFSTNLERIYKKIQKLNGPHPGIHGNKAIYSVMTDWNPAEIIGIKPRKLALTLYKELITDNIWAYMRHNYGYRDLRSFPLMISFLGFPYIDVRTSFNSFVPKTLDEDLSAKLVDYYIDCLSAYPADHDKVEFKIVFSCYYLNLNQKIKKLADHGFSELELDRIKFSLLSLTNNIIPPSRGLYKNDLQKIKYLQQRYQLICSSNLHLIDKIYWLTEDCKRYGTLPFAGLARAGFIAVQMLNSLVDCEIITQQESHNFINSLNTVARQLATDFELYTQGNLEKDELLDKYGHLRPGTYDILSTRYDEDFDLYFKSNSKSERIQPRNNFSFSAHQLKLIDKQLADNGILLSSAEFIQFIQEAIEGREYSKFVFTRSLSKILTLVSELGERYNFSKEQLSFLDIKAVLDLYANVTPNDLSTIFGTNIETNLREHNLTTGIKLPQLICSESDVYDFHLGNVDPNYITLSRVTNIVITEDQFPDVDLTGKIVFIRSADPGYDWIFSRNISGLVTMYGGANSHMAIRCAELAIPAVIGCGEENYLKWSTAKFLDIDCANKSVKNVTYSRDS